MNINASEPKGGNPLIDTTGYQTVSPVGICLTSELVVLAARKDQGDNVELSFQVSMTEIIDPITALVALNP